MKLTKKLLEVLVKEAISDTVFMSDVKHQLEKAYAIVLNIDVPPPDGLDEFSENIGGRINDVMVDLEELITLLETQEFKLDAQKG